eukprot:TRINITY_DN5890_c0_g1_i8.p1 TRINITY_DN5890_c0_g1~~TRINITY_DN5890_c0_g1_i8.p1  ORF type:complete len:673 (-),score=118.38 TRINITY_DN5890_c0_g1_i8:150-2168(-)
MCIRDSSQMSSPCRTLQSIDGRRLSEGGALASSSPTTSQFESFANSSDDTGSQSDVRMGVVGVMAEAVLLSMGPRHQALCRSSGTELAKAFAALVHTKTVPIVAHLGKKRPAPVPSRTDSDTVTVGESSSTGTRSSGKTSPIQIRQVRLPRPLSTIAYINDDTTDARDDKVVALHNDSSVVVSSTEHTTSSGGSVCTSFPSELSFLKACRRPGMSAAAAYHRYQENIQLSLMSIGTSNQPDSDPAATPSPETSCGTLKWLTDQHTSAPTPLGKLTQESDASGSNDGVSVSNGMTDSSRGSVEKHDGGIAKAKAIKLFHVHLLSIAPVSPTSTSLSGIHVVVNVEALALRPDSQGLKMARARGPSRQSIGVRILDGFCSNLDVQSVEFIGTSKVVSIGNGFLAGSFAESVSYGAMPRLRSVGDDWMFLCSRLHELTVEGTCDRLRTVGSRWLSECQSLVKFDSSAFCEVERVGSWWLSRCDSLEAASFGGMPSLVTVGDWWMSSCPALENVSFEGQSSLKTVGSGWLYAAVSIPSVSFSGLLSLREVGDRWMADCTWLRSVSHNGLVMLREVGSYWLSGCCMLNRVSMLGVDRLTTVGPYWLANTCAPHVECNSANSGRINALIDLTHDVLTQRGRIDPKMKIQLLDEALPAAPIHLLRDGSSSALLPNMRFP